MPDQALGNIIDHNRETWDSFYSEHFAKRLLYPEAQFLHLLHRYALKSPLKRGVCVGAGDAPEAFACVRLGMDMTCVDISPTAVTRLNGFAETDGVADRLRALVADQRDLSVLPSDSFDLAISWSVISYLSEEEAPLAIAELLRVLKPGGSFIGILESTESSGFYQKGAQQVRGRTYRMPAKSSTVRNNVMITFYTEPDVRELLASFEQLALGLKSFTLPPDLSHRVAQWVFHARKPGS